MCDVVQGFDDQATLGIVQEVLFEFAIIYRDLAGAWAYTHSGYCCLASASTEAITVNLVFLYGNHPLKPSESILNIRNMGI